MSHAQVHASGDHGSGGSAPPHGPDPRRRLAHVVTASYRDPDQIQAALEHLIRAGVPRDLVDVVVSPLAARRFYPASAGTLGNDAFRYAGAGGLLGLLVGSIISLVLIMLPGFFDKGIIPFVQLIGPNFVTVVGFMIGGAIGFFKRRPPNPHFARAAAEPEAIIMVVALRSREEAERIVQILARAGGNEPRIAT